VRLKRSMEVAQFTDKGAQKVPLYKSKAFEIKVICFEKGQEIPPHTHKVSDEILHIIKGTALVTVGDESWTAGHGTVIIGKAGFVHAVKNTGKDRLVIRSIFIPPLD